MSKQSRTKKQVKADKAALMKLFSSGLYTKKIDLRKAPTKYLKGLISKFADVIKGKAKIVTTPIASAYKSVFKIFGKDKVVVPKAALSKGDRLRVEKKTGQIIVEKKPGRNQKRSQRFLSREKVASGETQLKMNRRYGLPFRKGNEGTYQIRWFPTKKALENFMKDYEYEDWEDFVIEEHVTFKPKFATTLADQDEIDVAIATSPKYKRRYTAKGESHDE